MMIPLLIPGPRAARFPEGAESLHYSSCEFQTRVTEMKVITRHDSPDTLILIEVPVLPGAAECFPQNTIDYALEHNLFAEKAYPQQSEQAFATYHALRRARQEDSEPALRRPARGVQVLGHARDGELRVPEGAGVPAGVMAPRPASCRRRRRTSASRCCRRSRCSRGSACATSISTCITSSRRRAGRRRRARRVAAHGQRALGRVRRLVRLLPRGRRAIDDTFASVERQVAIARRARRRRAAAVLRPACRTTTTRRRARDVIVGNLRAAVRRASRHAVRVREPRRRVAPSRRLPRGPRARRPAEHPDELRSDQLRARRRRSAARARIVSRRSSATCTSRGSSAASTASSAWATSI